MHASPILWLINVDDKLNLYLLTEGINTPLKVYIHRTEINGAQGNKGMPGRTWWLFWFQGRGSLGTYVLLPTKPKEDTPAHKKKAESERSELSLSKEDTPAHNKRAESERSELSLSTTSTIIKCKDDKPAHNKRVEL